jgi:hypothetical protein
MKNNNWPTLFTQLLNMAEAQKPQTPLPAEAQSLAQQWEAMLSELEEGPDAADYYAYYENTQQDTRETETDLIDQQQWYDQLQQVQLFVQDVLHQST